ncbi:alpha-glucosidase [Treponema brennaborense]|uniref:Oligo-1,6-glucosidase n=1 Tax=Treponema brennaborense (strain DSM 12168 / CIP 105900 / DD5/3) TaxID=906968 RepID=F4LPV2_TREBD|nr:alpha-glucosidase [Treponema brennaborense]AEE16044.1 Oligo-1,6-glucosidase [Treponema brennaborense DSM 12168]
MQKKWWHGKAAYQIYPKSFLDTDADGIGDLQGITQKLDYLKELGIDIIWISPVYPSPFVDQGYDISDYRAIDPRFGTMDDFDNLIAQAKKRGMYIVMDLVLNHCSDKHEWFQKALADPEGPYADYFYFVEGKNGKPPCNWRSYFGGSVWEPVPGTSKYYLHSFAKEQPDLNWNNPAVRQELYDMINWWARKGVAGFRIDAIINIKKDTSWQDTPADGDDGMSSIGRMIDAVEGVGDFLEELKRCTFALHDSFTVGEVFNMKENELRDFIGDDGHFSTIFDFSAHCLTHGEHGWYDARPLSFRDWKNTVHDSQLKCMGVGFKANLIENHDEPRGVSTYLPPHARNDTGAKMLAACSVLLRGLPFLYQGQEIGMHNCPRSCIDEFDDISTKDQYKTAREAGLSEADALAVCNTFSRDNARTPMQWDSTENAGFTAGTPWQRVNPDYRTRNVRAQLNDPDSVWHFYRKLLALRKSGAYADVLTYGDYEPAYGETENVFAFRRTRGADCAPVRGQERSEYSAVSANRINSANQTASANQEASAETENCCRELLVIANFGTENETLPLEAEPKALVLSNMEETQISRMKITLRPCQVIVLEL